MAGHCLIIIARLRVQRGLLQGQFSGVTLLARSLAWNPPALCRPVLAGPCLTTVLRAGVSAWSSSGSIFRPDWCDPGLAQNLYPQCLGPGRKLSPRGSDPRSLSWEEAVCSMLSPIGTPLSSAGSEVRALPSATGIPPSWHFSSTRD